MPEREKEYARRVELQITLEGKDITRDLAPYLLSFSYEDNRSGEADSVSLTLEDRAGLWRGDWCPKRNSKIEAAVALLDWENPGSAQTLKCGTFEIDEIEAAQESFTVKCVSVPVTAGGRREKETHAWEKTNLKTIARDVAAKAALELKYTAAENPGYERIDQKQESSMEFLKRLVEKAGLSLKIVNGAIAVYDEAAAEKEDPALVIDRTGGSVLSWRFRTQSVDTYKSCEVTYFDSKTKQTFHGTASAQGEDDPSGQVLRVENERVESPAAAQSNTRANFEPEEADIPF